MPSDSDPASRSETPIRHCLLTILSSETSKCHKTRRTTIAATTKEKQQKKLGKSSAPELR